MCSGPSACFDSAPEEEAALGAQAASEAEAAAAQDILGFDIVRQGVCEDRPDAEAFSKGQKSLQGLGHIAVSGIVRIQAVAHFRHTVNGDILVVN